MLEVLQEHEGRVPGQPRFVTGRGERKARYEESEYRRPVEPFAKTEHTDNEC